MAPQTTARCGDASCRLVCSSGFSGTSRKRKQAVFFKHDISLHVVKKAKQEVVHMPEAKRTTAGVPKVHTVRVQAVARPASPGEELLEMAKLVPDEYTIYWALVDALTESPPELPAVQVEHLLNDVPISKELAAFRQTSLNEALVQLLDVF